ncbi:MAG: hypothetical protein ACRDYC_13640 [Acidimicrobiales bacterium]
MIVTVPTTAEISEAAGQELGTPVNEPEPDDVGAAVVAVDLAVVAVVAVEAVVAAGGLVALDGAEVFVDVFVDVDAGDEPQPATARVRQARRGATAR